MTDIHLTTGQTIGRKHPCFVVAEIGQNHQGDVYTATRLMKAAADAGVDAVKLCKRDIASDLTKVMYDAPYNGDNAFGPTYGEHRKALELSPREYRHLAQRVRYNKWNFCLFATACDMQSVDDLESSINPPLYKIASRDLDNLPLLDYVARTKKPIIISAGMAQPGDITRALDTIREHHSRIILMVCTSQYPTANEHVGLRRLWLWRKQYGVLTGLSDHTPGITAGIAGAALGAVVIEKHLTLSRAMKGTDHAASLEPEALRTMVAKIREVEAMKSNAPLPCCDDTRWKLGRSLVTARAMQPGETITEADLCLKSPGTGIHWPERARIVGKVCRRVLPADVTIYESDIMEAANVSR